MLSLPTLERPQGFVFYDGASVLDGERILAICTGLINKSQNRKTGPLVSSWILRADREPQTALSDGSDVSVCGDCIHRKVDGLSSCYVATHQAPLQVYRTFVRGGYASVTLAQAASLVAGEVLRLGSYGDPTAVPFPSWKPLIDAASWHVGYTHQWRRAFARPFRRFLMASVESEEEAEQAQAKRWRTFRVGDDVLPSEVMCPAAEEQGKRRSCETCGACDGAGSNPYRRSIVIPVHGPYNKVFAFRNYLKTRPTKGA